MGGKTHNIRKFITETVTGSINPEIDEVRSEYPRLLPSGYWAWGAGSTIKTSILGGMSTGQRFFLRNIAINNDADEPNRVQFFDGPDVSVPVINIQVAKSTTNFIDNLKGYVFASAVHASLLTSLTQVRVGGLIASI